MGADGDRYRLDDPPASDAVSETVAFAAEAFDGTLTDLYIPSGR